MHARGCPTPLPSDPGNRAGGKGRTRRKNAAATSAVPAQRSGTGTGYGVRGTQTMGSEGPMGFGAASGRADIAGAPCRGEGPLLHPVAAIPIPTHTRWVHWSRGRAIAGCSCGTPPVAQAPSCPCLHGLGGAEALLILPHSGLVWRERHCGGGAAVHPMRCSHGRSHGTPDTPSAGGQQRGVKQRVLGAFFHAPPPKQPGTSPAAILAASVHAKCPCRTWVPPAYARDPGNPLP